MVFIIILGRVLRVSDTPYSVDKYSSPSYDWALITLFFQFKTMKYLFVLLVLVLVVVDAANQQCHMCDGKKDCKTAKSKDCGDKVFDGCTKVVLDGDVVQKVV